MVRTQYGSYGEDAVRYLRANGPSTTHDVIYNLWPDISKEEYHSIHSKVSERFRKERTIWKNIIVLNSNPELYKTFNMEPYIYKWVGD